MFCSRATPKTHKFTKLYSIGNRRDDGRAYSLIPIGTNNNIIIIIIIMIDRQLKTVSVVGWCGWVKGSIDRGGRAPNEL